MTTVKLGDVIQITSGFAFPSSGFSTEEGIPLVRIRDVTRGISETRYAGPFDEDYVVNDGDLLVGMDGEFNAALWRGGRALLNQRVCRLVPDPSRLDFGFLRHVLPRELKAIEDRTPFVTVKHLSVKDIRAIVLALPPLAEQRRIATILDKADSLRRKRQAAIRLADEFLQAAYIEILGDPNENNDRWPIFELGELVESTKLGLVRSSEEFGWDLPTPYLRMDAITNDGKVLHNKIQGTRATPTEVADFGLKRGDLLFNTRNSRELVGKTALWDGPDGAVFNNNIMRIRFKGSIAPEVVAMQFRLPALKRELESRKSGTTSVFAIYYKDLKTMPIQVPSGADQEKFARIAQQTRTYIAKVDAMSKEAEALSLALSHRFFGELQS